MNAGESFHRGYRGVAMVSTGMLPRGHAPKIRCAVREHLSESQKEELYLGTCFGRYDVIYDFPCEFAKIASYQITQIQKSILRSGIPCSTSQLLCKIVFSEGPGVSTGPVRTYTFLRPKGQDLPIGDVAEALRSIDQTQITSATMMWNLSLFPLVVVLDGASLSRLMRVVRDIRKRLYHVVSSTNTIVSLAFGGTDSNEPESVSVVTYVKPRSIEPQPNWDLMTCGFHGPLKQEIPAVTSGWFDFCMSYSGDSLARFLEDYFRLMDVYGDQVLQTTSVFHDLEA